MSPPPVRIKIGGAIDSSLAAAFRTAAQMGAQTERALQRQKKQTTGVAESEAKKQLRAQQQLSSAAESLQRQRSAALYRQHRQQEASADRAGRAELRTRQRTEENARREIDKTVRAAVRALDQEMRARDRAVARNRDRFATRTSHRASRFLMPEAPLGSMIMGGVRGFAQGAGLDFSIGGGVGRAIALQQQAIDLSNSGYQAGAAGPKGQRVDPNTLIGQARSIGDRYGIDASDVLGGLAQFQKVAGDLDAGRQTLDSMAKLSKATGTNFAELAAATANVSNGLGDIPNKAELIDQVMRTVAGQGKLGAVEISDMATQMARVAAAAGSFSGDRAANIQKMGALMQIARAEGGAPSAAEAARSVGGFANTMKKSARIDAFRSQGIDVFADKAHTQLKDPIELIKQSLTATGGDLEKMNKLFMDVIGARAVGGLQKTFVGAGGGSAGLAKVDEQISRMLRAQMSKDEVSKSAAAGADSIASKAARFQNKLDEISAGALASLLPALEQLEKPTLKVARVLGSLAESAASNPWTAVGVAMSGAVAAAIARASIESVFRAGVERMFAKGGMPTAGAGKLGAAGLGIGVGAALGASIYASGVGGFESSEDAMKGEGKALLGALGSKNPDEIFAAVMAQRARVATLKKGDWADSTPVVGDAWNWATNANETKKVELNTAQATLGRMEGYLATLLAGGGAAGGGAPLASQLQVQNEQLQRELQQSQRIQQQMLEQLRTIATKPDAPGAPAGGRGVQ